MSSVVEFWMGDRLGHLELLLNRARQAVPTIKVTHDRNLCSAQKYLFWSTIGFIYQFPIVFWQSHNKNLTVEALVKGMGDFILQHQLCRGNHLSRRKTFPIYISCWFSRRISEIFISPFNIQPASEMRILWLECADGFKRIWKPGQRVNEGTTFLNKINFFTKGSSCLGLCGPGELFILYLFYCWLHKRWRN